MGLISGTEAHARCRHDPLDLNTLHTAQLVPHKC